MRIGAINWDAVLPANTYFGGYALRTLGNEKYKSRLHFQTFRENGKYDFPHRTGEMYDRELQYAIDGGLDFFAYCWYPDSDEARNVCPENEQYEYLVPYYHELNAARKLYQSSKLNNKINMCAILLSCNAYAMSDIEALADAMGESYYEKVDGKPLLILFGGYSMNFIKIIREYLADRGITPYIALVEDKQNNEYEGVDAITEYACGSGVENFPMLNKISYEKNVGRLKYKLPVMPLMTAGWNPTPRIDKPSPWVSYDNVNYAGVPKMSDFVEGFSLLTKFVSENKEYANTDHALVFAWNEFEEGGYLCPTINEDGTVNDSVIKNFAGARKSII